MKKLSLIILLFSCNNRSPDLIIQKKARIDSLSNHMDTVVFKAKEFVKETGIVEHYNSYGAFYNKDFPEFGKFTVHNHDSTFIDTSFYYYKGKLIKFTATKTKNNRILNSTTFYFEDQKTLEPKKTLDSNSIKLLLIASDKHLQELKKISNRLTF